jgi:hypothetical protein
MDQMGKYLLHFFIGLGDEGDLKDNKNIVTENLSQYVSMRNINVMGMFIKRLILYLNWEDRISYLPIINLKPIFNALIPPALTLNEIPLLE